MTFQAGIFAVLLIFVAVYPSPRHFSALDARLAEWTRYRRRCLLLAALIPVLLCGALVLRHGIPVPYAHDEFAYLLGADTFSRGRLTNPTHPLWEHFETYHVIHQPTYQMKYPPVQSVFLAIGSVLTGQPITGVWLSLACAMAALAWMLRAWVLPRWALLATLLAATSLPILTEWGLTYWGGGVGMLGGSLYLGGLRRWLLRPSAGAALAASLGIAALANSRPYEGLVFVTVSSLLFAPRMVAGEGLRKLRSAWPELVPATVVLALSFGWMGYYNYRVAGDPFTLPYQVWSRQYGGGGTITSSLAFFTETARQTRQRRLTLLKSDVPTWHREDQGDPTDLVGKLDRFGRFYLMIPTAVPVALALIGARSRIIGYAAPVLALLTLAVVLENEPGLPHYLAPGTCLVFVLAAKGLQAAAVSPPLGLNIGRTLTLPLLGASLAVIAASWSPETRMNGNYERAEVGRRLEALGGRHVVIVRYGPEHWFSQGWVYNGADIDRSTVVWAQDLGETRRRELIQYYPERKFWLLEADARPAKLTLLETK